MLFTSPVFLFLFLPVVLTAYYLSPPSWRNTLLLSASLLFYAWGEVFYTFALLFSVLVNHFLGLRLGQATPARRRLLLSLGIGFNLALLGWFKYANFIVANINTVLLDAGLATLSWRTVHLPLGISFFTFQALSYLIDIYRQEVKPQTRWTETALYITLFPQLIAGPIVRYHDIARQLLQRTVNSALFLSGCRRFIIGLAKKILLANTLGQTADQIFAQTPEQLGAAEAWLGVICYTLQIYFDFSAYSDMAIGLGRMFGFRFLENFNYPYIARSVQAFWRRWHMSLSSWFRDYLYIPLGGSRCEPWRVYFNLLLVFLLCGFWHGASWNFIVWGAWHGIFLALERTQFGTALTSLWRPLQHFYTLLVVMLGWVFFRAEDLSHATAYLQAMSRFGQDTAAALYYLSTGLSVTLLVAVMLSMPLYRTLTARLQPVLERTPGGYCAVHILVYGGLLGLSLLNIAANTYDPFIYFRF